MKKQLVDKINEYHMNDENEKILELIDSLEEMDYDAYSLKARALINLGRPDEALRDLMAVEEQGKEDPLWNFRMMYAHYELGISDKAVNFGLKAFGVSPEIDKDTVMFVAYSYIDLEKYQEAIDILNRYRQEENPYWNECMGRAYYLREQYVEASMYFKNALERLGEEDAQMIMYTSRALFIAYEKLGKFDEMELLRESYPQLGADIESYSEGDLELLEAHINKHFGPFEAVFHEIVSTDIHVDIAISEPTPERNHYVLCTIGMGAKLMKAMPEEYRAMGYGRLELLVALPADWDIKSPDEKWYWPLRWLKILSRLPVDENIWLGWGHTIPNGEPYAENTKLECILLEMPYEYGAESFETDLSNGEQVHFLQLIPLYKEEMEYKIKNGTDALVKLFDHNFTGVININRKNYAKKSGQLEGVFKWKNKPVS